MGKNDNGTVKRQQLLIGGLSLLLIIILTIVAAVEMEQTRKDEYAIDVDSKTAGCINCHLDKGMAVKMIDAWKESKHAIQGVGCMECHKAEEKDFDAFKCPESKVLVARHPTPKDCKECHKQQVEEFANSKHAHQFWLLKNADRSIFENPMSTRNGCEQCHNISNLWPDGSVGECDSCHPKHSFSKAVARQPETCGECHIGPDHPHIEIYLESKHGNIFKAKGKNWDMNYSTMKTAEIPHEAPVCTTCHMDGTKIQKMTHNVSARLSWESQATWSFRTVWDGKNLGTWQEKQASMNAVCNRCHAPEFVNTYILTSDLTNLQYNEIRRFFVYWMKKLTENGTIKRLKADGKFMSDHLLNGWDEEPEKLMYYAWHHEGRRFRHGAMMMGADFTQWHGIWELQEDIVELLRWAAEHGDEEAKRWIKSNHPSKFVPYALYDMPGNAWGINAKSNTTPFVYNNYADYWKRIFTNVEAAYKHNLLSKEQWDLWLKRYENKEHYLGLKYKDDEEVNKTWQFYKDRDDIDSEKMKEQVVDFKLPGKPFYK